MGGRCRATGRFSQRAPSLDPGTALRQGAPGRVSVDHGPRPDRAAAAPGGCRGVHADPAGEGQDGHLPQPRPLAATHPVRLALLRAGARQREEPLAACFVGRFALVAARLVFFAVFLVVLRPLAAAFFGVLVGPGGNQTAFVAPSLATNVARRASHVRLSPTLLQALFRSSTMSPSLCGSTRRPLPGGSSLIGSSVRACTRPS